MQLGEGHWGRPSHCGCHWRSPFPPTSPPASGMNADLRAESGTVGYGSRVIVAGGGGWGRWEE